MPKAISHSKRNSILSGLDAGHSVSRIVADCHVSRATVSNIRAKYRPRLARSTGGRPRKLSPAAIRYAVRILTHDNTVSTSQVTQKLCEITGESLHPQTVRRALKSIGLKTVKNVKKTKVSKKATREGIALAKAHQRWIANGRK